MSTASDGGSYNDSIGMRNHASKGETKTEMERAEILVLARIGIDAVIEADRANGKFVA